MLESYLEEIKEYHPDQVNFIRDLNEVLKRLTGEEKLMATHAYCTDGGIAGTALRYSFPDAKIIPVDYWYLNSSAADVLSNLPWYGIVDLKPFNKLPMQFWVDHHLGAMGSTPNAKQIRFDVNGDSGSYQLLLSKFTPLLPEHIIELILMTRITDTAGYVTPPPIEKITNFEELQFEPSNDVDKDLPLYERKVWLLDDVWRTINSYKEHQKFYTGCAKDGFYYLSNYLNEVNKLRDERRRALEIASSLDVAECVVFAVKEYTIDKTSLLRGLLQRPETKVVISLNIYPKGVRISFRRSKGLSEMWNQKLQLHELAKEMEGGGHAAASGGHAGSVEEAVEQIKRWAHIKDLSFIFHDLSNLTA